MKNLTDAKDILEQYWAQRHGMYVANQDDVEMANSEAAHSLLEALMDRLPKKKYPYFWDDVREVADDFSGTPETLVEVLKDYMVSAYNGGYNQATQDITKTLDQFFGKETK